MLIGGKKSPREPVVGKRSTLHSKKDEVIVKEKREGYPEKLTHDCQHTLGWNRRG